MSRDDNYRKAMTKQLELIDQFHGLLPVGRDSLFQTVVLVFKGGSLLDPHLHLQTEDYFHNDGGGGEGEEVGLQTMFRIDAHFSDPRRSQLPKFQDDVRLILLMLL
jgi:hypothetical protein